MKFKRILFSLLIGCFFLSACAAPASPSDAAVKADPSPFPAQMGSAASEPASQGAALSDPAAVTLPSVPIKATEFFKVFVPLGQFSFLSPTDAKVSVMGAQASANWEDLNLMVAISYRAHTVDAIDPLTAVDLGILNEIGIDPGQVQVSDGDELTISGYTTRSIRLSIDISEAPLKGEALSVILTDHSYLFVFGMQMMAKPSQDWEKDGKMRFQQIARSIDFDPAADPGLLMRCDMATDLEYGYSPDKPVKVGGGDRLGETRMEIFINNLVDPQTSNALVIAPLDPIQAGSQILHRWEFESGNEKRTLYFDTNTADDPKTPVGISCRGSLPQIELLEK